MTVRRLDLSDATPLIALRLEALRDDPEAFGSSYEDFSALTDEGRAQWAKDRLTQPDSGIFGAFLRDRLVGMVGLVRVTERKSRHHSTLWGMYVAPEGRRQGLGRQLVEAAIAFARTLPDLEWIQLTVVPTQTAAFRLYPSLGFVEWGREPGALKVAGRDLDEAHMALRLE